MVHNSSEVIPRYEMSCGRKCLVAAKKNANRPKRISRTAVKAMSGRPSLMMASRRPRLSSVVAVMGDPFNESLQQCGPQTGHANNEFSARMEFNKTTPAAIRTNLHKL